MQTAIDNQHRLHELHLLQAIEIEARVALLVLERQSATRNATLINRLRLAIGKLDAARGKTS